VSIRLSPEQIGQLQAIGNSLQQRRRELGWSLEEVNARTLIRKPILEAIETADVSNLPEPIYIQALIRRYGNALKMDGNALSDTLAIEPPTVVSEVMAGSALKTFGSPSDDDTLPKLQINAEEMRERLGESLAKFRPYLLIGGSVVVAIALIAFLRQPLAAFISQLNQNSQSRPRETQPSPVPVVSPSPTLSAASPPQNQLEIVIKLTDESWLQVDVDGRVAFEGTLPKGTERKFIARTRTAVSAGNAGAVSVSVNQQPAKPLGRPGEVREEVFTANN